MNEAKWFEDDEPMMPVLTPHGTLVDLVRVFPHYQSGYADAVVSSIHGRDVEIVSMFKYFAPTFDSVAIWILGTGQRGLDELMVRDAEKAIFEHIFNDWIAGKSRVELHSTIPLIGDPHP